MAEVEVRVEVNSDADSVWSLIGGFNDIPKWNPGSVAKSEMDGDGVGAVRTLTLPQGPVIRERMTTQDDAGRSYSYTILEGPLPVRNYRATLGVASMGEGRSAVIWSASFDPAEGFPEEKAVKIIDGMFRGGLAAMEKQLAG